MAHLHSDCSTIPAMTPAFASGLSVQPHYADDKESLLYVMLPRMVKSRIRRLPSLRRSVSGYVKTPQDAPELDRHHSRRSSGDYPVTDTPPPEYRPRMSISEPTSDREDTEEEDLEEESNRASRQVSPRLLPVVIPQSHSGINWKFANQGLTLLNLAAEESSTSSMLVNDRSPSLARQLYIHAMTYLLRGLPSNLTPEEQISVLSAVPDEVKELAKPLVAPTSELSTTSTSAADLAPEDEPSLLHRLLASLIVHIFLFLNFLLPYVKSFLASAYRYEREHRISEKLFASGMGTMDSLLRWTVRLGNKVCSMNNGKVGTALNDLSLWWIRGVTGGIHEGVGEGLMLMGGEGHRRRSSSFGRRSR